MRYSSRSNDGFWDWVGDHPILSVAIIVVLVLAVFLARPINKVSNIRTIEGVVTEKTTKNTGEGGKYMVFVESDDGVVIPLEVTDSLLRFRFNSADTWGNIREGERYSFEVGGSRWGLMSWYPNIYDFKKIE